MKLAETKLEAAQAARAFPAPSTQRESHAELTCASPLLQMKLAETKLEAAQAALAKAQAALQQKEEQLAAAQAQVADAREAAAEAQADAQAAMAAAAAGGGDVPDGNPLMGQPPEVTHATVGGWFASFLLLDERWGWFCSWHPVASAYEGRVCGCSLLG